MKAGWRTTEFWLTLVSVGVAVLAQTGALPAGDVGEVGGNAAKVATGVFAAIALVGYIWSRTRQKQQAIGTAAKLLIGLLLPLGVIGCQAQKADHVPQRQAQQAPRSVYMPVFAVNFKPQNGDTLTIITPQGELKLAAAEAVGGQDGLQTKATGQAPGWVQNNNVTIRDPSLTGDNAAAQEATTAGTVSQEVKAEGEISPTVAAGENVEATNQRGQNERDDQSGGAAGSPEK